MVLIGLTVAMSVSMPAALADNVYLSILDVSPPSAGSIDSIDSNFSQIHCGPDAPGPCTITDQQSELGSRPTTGWYTYTLQASNGPAGYTWRWTSGCAGMTPTCTVTNDQEYTSVGGEWLDTQAPVLTGMTMATVSSLPLQLAAVATSTGTYFSASDLTDGDWNVSVQPVDAAGNTGTMSGRHVRIDTVPAKVTITSPRNNQAVDSFSPRVGYTADETVQTSCAVDGGTPQLCANGSRLPMLDNGPPTLAVIAYDAANNISVAIRKFSVVEPQVSLVGAAESVYGRRASITVQTAKLSFGQVEFDDAGTGAPLCIKPAGLSGKVTCTFSGTHFRPGRHDVFVRYTGDSWHNMAAATFQYTVDRKPATMAVTAHPGQVGPGQPVTLIAQGLPLAGPYLVRRVERSGQLNLRTSRPGAKRSTTPSGFHGHAGTAVSPTSRSIARTIARTPFAVLTISGVSCSERALISDAM